VTQRQAADRVDRGGGNLANAFHALRNRSDWPDTLDTIKLLIDDDIADLTRAKRGQNGTAARRSAAQREQNAGAGARRSPQDLGRSTGGLMDSGTRHVAESLDSEAQRNGVVATAHSPSPRAQAPFPDL